MNFVAFPALWSLAPPDRFGFRMVLSKSYLGLLVFSITWIMLRLTDAAGLVFWHRTSESDSRSTEQLVHFLKETVKIIICISALFFILGAIFRLDITSLIAGLGIGGLALALAAKETVENLMGSLTIFLDKPFVVGDQVQTGTVKGTVERIGFRSTRNRTEEKSFITVPNKKNGG